MKISIQISDADDEEIIVKCKSMDKLKFIQNALAEALGKQSEIQLELGVKSFYIKINDILFFETDGNRTCAHTAKAIYTTDKKLYELEGLLPHSFVKASKSCIINTSLISSVARNLTGPSEAEFIGTTKTAFVSRKYYKDFIERINQTRLSK